MARHNIFLDLNQSEIATLQHFMKRMSVHGNFRVHRRGSAILLSHQKKTVKEIASCIGKSENSVYLWLKRYREKGINGIAPRIYPTKLTEEQVTELLKVGHYHSPWKNLKEYEKRWSFRRMAKWVKDNWNIEISYVRIREIVRERMKINPPA
jgi:transposase